jgi:hypothetical protein
MDTTREKSKNTCCSSSSSISRGWLQSRLGHTSIMWFVSNHTCMHQGGQCACDQHTYPHRLAPIACCTAGGGAAPAAAGAYHVACPPSSTAALCLSTVIFLNESCQDFKALLEVGQIGILIVGVVSSELACVWQSSIKRQMGSGSTQITGSLLIKVCTC